ncbi:hypothetical protein MMC28_002774 [Mycoblastus sanguinarius]|nr:hypothetical protein [Mycoblastus sanguinarius]
MELSSNISIGAHLFNLSLPILVPPTEVFSDTDFWDCDDFYSTPSRPKPLDCVPAFNLLRSGTEIEHWYTNAPKGVTNSLPIIVRSGTCEIQFHASGKYASENTLDLPLAPDDIRTMARYVLEKCVDDTKFGGEQKGGFVTKGLQHTTDFLTAKKTLFPGGPLPASMTFFTAMVWNSATVLPGYEPGCCDPTTAHQLAIYLEQSIDRAPEGGDLKDDLENRLTYIYATTSQMGRFNLRTWWDKPVAKLELPSSIGNATGDCEDGVANCSILSSGGGDSNLTSLSVAGSANGSAEQLPIAKS